eukprot:1388171-Prymnesium_polylepis.1
MNRAPCRSWYGCRTTAQTTVHRRHSPRVIADSVYRRSQDSAVRCCRVFPSDGCFAVLDSWVCLPIICISPCVTRESATVVDEMPGAS